MFDDRLDRSDVSRFWDGLLGGEPATPDLVDPATAETVHHLRTLAASPIPTSARERARTRILTDSAMARYQAPTLDATATPKPPRSITGPNGRSAAVGAWPVLVPGTRRQSRFRLGVTIALLLVVTLVTVYVVVRPDNDPAVIAPIIPATPTATVGPTLTSETLIDVTLPAGAIPIDERGFFVFARYSVGPGFGIGYREPCAAPAVVVSVIESGTFSVRATGPFDLVRGESSAEPGARRTIAAGEETLLAPGDALIYANTTADLFTGFDNPGPQTLVVLEAAWFSSAACVLGPPGGMKVDWDTYDETPAIDPTRPVMFTLQSLTAEPGATLTGGGADAVGNVPPGDRILERIYVQTGTLEVTGLPAPAWAWTTPDAATPDAATPVAATPDAATPVAATTYVVTGGSAAVDLDAPPDGVPVELRNSGSRPLVATVLTIRYAPP